MSVMRSNFMIKAFNLVVDLNLMNFKIIILYDCPRIPANSKPRINAPLVRPVALQVIMVKVSVRHHVAAVGCRDCCNLRIPFQRGQAVLDPDPVYLVMD